MDIFNREKVKRLERELADVKIERNQSERESERLRAILEEVTLLKEVTPPDCVTGPWCAACNFNRPFHIIKYFGPVGHQDRMIDTIYVCNKAESCKNFVQKEV